MKTQKKVRTAEPQNCRTAEPEISGWLAKTIFFNFFKKWRAKYARNAMEENKMKNSFWILFKTDEPNDVVIKVFAEDPEKALQVAYNIIGDEALTLNIKRIEEKK